MKKYLSFLLAICIVFTVVFGGCLTTSALTKNHKVEVFGPILDANVGMATGDEGSDVNATWGYLDVKGSNGAGVVTNVLNSEPFTANQDVTIEFDYNRVNSSWSDDRILIGAVQGNAQWGCLVIRLTNEGSAPDNIGSITDELYGVLATGGTGPITWNTPHHFRITIDRATSTMNVFITKIGEEEAATPTITYTGDKVNSVAGGLAFMTWASEFEIRNAKITADGEYIMNTDFSKVLDTDVTGSSENGGSANRISNGAHISSNGAGQLTITDFLIGKSYEFTEVGFDYTPASTYWNADDIAIGCKFENSNTEALNITVLGAGNTGTGKASISLRYIDWTATEVLGTSEIELVEGTTYHMYLALDRENNGADLYVWTGDTKPATPTISATSECISKISGDFALKSFGGYYDVTNAYICYSDTVGDFNNDGSIDVADLVRFKKYFANTVVFEDGVDCDIDSNGEVETADLIALRKDILGIKLQ